METTSTSAKPEKVTTPMATRAPGDAPNPQAGMKQVNPISSQGQTSSSPKTGAATNEWADKIQAGAGDLDRSVQSFIKKSPVSALLIAVGVGFVGSVILKKIGTAGVQS
jgi:hypothetical protein